MNTENKKTNFVLSCKHFDVKRLRGDITFHLCNAINKVAPWQAIGAQKFKGVWCISLKTGAALATLLEADLIVNDLQVKLFGDNPYLHKQGITTEKVVIKVYPMWEDNSSILNYFKSLPNIELYSEEVHVSKARNSETNNISSYVNGDRFVYLKSGFDPLPDRASIAGFNCRLWYASRRHQCDRCHESHKTSDVDLCDAYRHTQPNVHVFGKGPLSNFSSCKMTMDNMAFRTSEHAYQWHACMNHLSTELAEKVMSATTPKEAQQVASQVKGNNSICDWENIKYGVMKKVLLAKANSSNQFCDELLGSGECLLVESSSRDPYWGSGLSYHMTVTTHPDYYPGKNYLGKLLCEIRSELRAAIKLAVEEETNPATSNNLNPSSCDDVPEMKSQTDGIHCTIKRDITSRSRLGGSKSHTRVYSISPNRQRGMKGSKFDTPLLKDFLRKQVKLSGHVSTVHSQPEQYARPEYNTPPSQESDIDSDNNI